MDGDGVFDAAGVAAGEGNDDGDPAAHGGSKDGFVAGEESGEGEVEAAELIVVVGVGAGDVEDDIGGEGGEGAFDGGCEDGEVLFVADAVGEGEVEVGGRFDRGVVVLLVDGEGEDGGVGGEDGGGAVAVVDVGIDDHGAGNQAFGLEGADGDGNVVEGTEAFAVVGEGVMEAAADVVGGVVGEGEAGGEEGAAGGEEKAVSHGGAPGDFEGLELARGEGAVAKGGGPGGGVDELDLGVGSGFRGVDGGVGEAFADEAVFLGGEDVGAEVEVVGGVVDEGDHEAWRAVTRAAA